MGPDPVVSADAELLAARMNTRCFRVRSAEESPRGGNFSASSNLRVRGRYSVRLVSATCRLSCNIRYETLRYYQAVLHRLGLMERAGSSRKIADAGEGEG